MPSYEQPYSSDQYFRQNVKTLTDICTQAELLLESEHTIQVRQDGPGSALTIDDPRSILDIDEDAGEVFDVPFAELGAFIVEAADQAEIEGRALLSIGTLAEATGITDYDRAEWHSNTIFPDQGGDVEISVAILHGIDPAQTAREYTIASSDGYLKKTTVISELNGRFVGVEQAIETNNATVTDNVNIMLQDSDDDSLRQDLESALMGNFASDEALDEIITRLITAAPSYLRSESVRIVAERIMELAVRRSLANNASTAENGLPDPYVLLQLAQTLRAAHPTGSSDA